MAGPERSAGRGGVIWRKSSWSSYNGSCVEVGLGQDYVLVRDSKHNGIGPILSFTRKEWQSFLLRIRNGSAGPA